ncbi:MAG: DUF2232 domain-containing protein [Rhodospirillaceae bacterium]|nr:DUF2232 domain-containing protein [Rhodospirillaceae bacterium]
MNRTALLAVAAGVFGATLLVAAMSGSVLGVAFGLLLSPLPLAMAVLGLGPAALPVAVIGGATTTMVLTGTFVGPLVYVINDALPVAVLLRQARAAGTPGPAPGAMNIGAATAWLAVIGVGLMVAVLAAVPAGPDGLEATLRTGIEKLLAEVIQNQGERPEVMQAAEALKASAAIMPGAAGWNWCLRAIISAAIAQAALVRMGYAAWPSPAYRGFAVPGWFIAVFWATAATAWVAPGDIGYVATNAAGVLCLPLLLQGLAVVHSGVGRMENAGFWLVGFYVLAVLTAGLSFVVLVTLGVVDHFLKLRQRMAAPPQGGV